MIEQSANHVHPTTRPPSTSVNQCTPRNTRLDETATAIAAATPARTAFTVSDRPRPSSSANAAYVAAAAVACPDGNEVPAKPVS